jgi:L-fucose isomerase-like protein
MEESKLKTGFVVCASHKDGILDPQGRPYVDRELVNACQDSLMEWGIECVEYPVVVASKMEARAAFDAMLKNDQVQSIIIFPGTWSWVANLTAAIRHFSLSGKGILLWVYPGAQGWRTGSGLLLHGALKEINVKHTLIYGEKEDVQTQKALQGFVLANQIKADLSMSTFCLFGGRGQAQSCGSVDPSQLMQRFGIDVDAVSPLEVYECVKSIDEEIVVLCFDRINRLFHRELLRTEINEKAVRLYLALSELVQKNNYLGIAIQNFPGIADYYTIPSLAQSLLIEDRVGNSALGDMNVALTTYILLRASHQAVFYGDIQNIDLEENCLKIVADGSAAPSLAAKEFPLGFGTRGIKHEGGGGGLTVSLLCREGQGVLAKLVRDNGQLQMVAARCDVFIPEEAELESCLNECGIPFWPHAFTRVWGDIRRLIEVWGGEYICLAYGETVYETLDAFCETTDIQFIGI